MNLLEQSVTVQQIAMSPITWWVSGILFYLVGGLILRNAMIRYWAKKNKKYNQSRFHDGQEAGVFFAHLLFPASLIVIAIVGLFFNQDKADRIYLEEYNKDKK